MDSRPTLEIRRRARRRQRLFRALRLLAWVLAGGLLLAGAWFLLRLFWL